MSYKLVLIGGVPRAGKSILRNRLLSKYGIPGFTTDMYRDSLRKKYTEDAFKLQSAERIKFVWPNLKSLIHVMAFYTDSNYVLEGDLLQTEYLVNHELPENAIAIFLGYTEISPQEKFAAIRANKSYGDWTAEMSDQELMDMATGLRQQSQVMKDTCERHAQLSYFDTGSDFDTGLQAAEDHILNHLDLY